MGAVDLVIQVESPKSVARGLQRVGRAGHELGAVSKGRIFPKFRADLLESAVVARAHARRRDRGDRDPAQPARRARAADRRDLRRRGDRGRRAARRSCAAPTRSPISRASSSRTCSTCSPGATRPTSSPSCGRGSSGTARPASSAAAQGARRLAVTNAGTIPDRGLYGVHLVDGGGRVGELDEEMVYEARAGQTFMLGASTWRIEEITRDRVLVSPAPGVPGAIPFWKGEGAGGPYELGEAIGEASRELVALTEDEGARAPDATSTRSTSGRRRTCSPSSASSRRRPARCPPTGRSSSSASATRSATGGSASSRPFGARVHAPWAMAIGARLRDALGLEAQAIWSDDGIALHLPDADAPPPIEELLLDPERGRGARHAASSARRRSSARASARTRAGRC